MIFKQCGDLSLMINMLYFFHLFFMINLCIDLDPYFLYSILKHIKS